ncbi:MAG: hypothetical protein JWQ04_666 [Pedosphaera sp.]|nr:hypothetical protein [Pedosphaera sp.]
MRSKSKTVTDDPPAKPSWKTIILFSVIAAVVIVSFAFLKFPFLFMPSPYLRFMDKDITYYTEVAHACDLLVRQHPVSSTNSVELYKGMVLPFTLRLSGQDASLPKIIKALHPQEILVSSNRLVITIPPERMGGFDVFWKQDDLQTNQWILESNVEGLGKIVYQETKP